MCLTRRLSFPCRLSSCAAGKNCLIPPNKTLQDCNPGTRCINDGPPHEWDGPTRANLANAILTEFGNSHDSWESAMSNLDALRELRPTGSGRLIDSKSVGVDLRHRLSERLTFLLDTVVFRNETNNNSFNQANDEQRTYLSVQPRLRWRLTRWWDIVGSYRYRYQKYDERSDSAASNSVFVYVTYNWPRESVARWSEL